MIRRAVLIAAILLVVAGAVRAEAGGTGRRAPAPDRSFPVEDIRQALLRHLERQYAGKASEVEVRILEPRQPILLPPGAVTARVAEQGPETHAGPRRFSVALAVDGRPVRTVTVIAEVDAQAEVVAPVRLIQKDDLLEEDDLAVTRVPLTEEAPEFVWRLEDAVGKRAVRALPPRQPLRPSSLAAPYAVRKGERVVIEAKRGGLTIRTAGLTKAGGVVGQSIVVTNVDSGKQLQATVIAPGVVQVEF